MGTVIIIIIVVAVLGFIFGGSEGAAVAGGTAAYLLFQLFLWGVGIFFMFWLFSAIFL